MGEWVLQEACRTVTALQGANGPSGSLVMWVNLSGRQLVQPGLPERIARILAETGADPTTLGLEITESVIMEDTRVSDDTLRTLKRLGLQIAIDDFGTGFSSLSRLRRFPVDVLKVDRSFVAGIGRDEEDSVIVRAVVGLAHSLGMTAVAEGVESLEQSAALRAMGCDVAQGFYFSEPVEARALAARLRAGTLPGSQLLAAAPAT
jgi:EAL domain-containing protein (putative c-di-GMP-specific phosphodiesterase class I)